MAYFTIVHWLTLFGFFVIFVILSVISLRETNRKILLAMIFSIFLVIGMLSVLSMFILDKYTKKAALEEMDQKRILLNESFSISGKIRNIGRFDIAECSLEVKLVNEAIDSGNISGSVFTPRSGLGDFFKSKNVLERPYTIVQDFVIARNLKKGELRNFSVLMPYPSYFQKPNLKYTLECR
ncbi:MAG: DUF2393 family protein [Sulfurospirillaceae bacterium]|nr:DUF2393 family protein [Sulfurospirillaceae bacterium]MDD3462187.1 DUF2393 family protein [Sulfurospirillaceae bacterium]